MAKVLDRAEPRQILKHCEMLGLDGSLLASCLAVNPKTVQRWQEGSAQPNEAGLRALDKIEVISQLDARPLETNAMDGL